MHTRVAFDCVSTNAAMDADKKKAKVLFAENFLFVCDNLCVVSENSVKRSKCLLAGTRLQVEGRGPLPKSFPSKFVQHEPYLTAKFI